MMPGWFRTRTPSFYTVAVVAKALLQENAVMRVLNRCIATEEIPAGQMNPPLATKCQRGVVVSGSGCELDRYAARRSICVFASAIAWAPFAMTRSAAMI